MTFWLIICALIGLAAFAFIVFTAYALAKGLIDD